MTKTKYRLAGYGMVVLLLAIWEIAVATGILKSISMPKPSEAFEAWGRILADGTLVDEVGGTLKRMFLGFLIASVVGIPIGLLMGVSKWLHGLFEPTMELLRPIPSPAYIPVAILLLGIGDEMKVAVVALAAVFPILVSTYQGVVNMDPVLRDTGRTLGLSRPAILRRIVLPGALPSIMTGMRISLGISFIVVVVAEMMIGSDGIGNLIMSRQRSYRIGEMYAGIFTLATLGYSFNWLFIRAEKFLLRGQERAYVE